MDVDQVAETLKRSGITPETIFICWHTNKFDLTILREFLEKGGYTGILPGDDKCFPLIPIFRKNVPKSLSMKLEVLFQVLYPAHNLIGHNHRALPDCQQTRLVCDCLDEMFEKSDDRSERWKKKALRCFYKKSMVQQSIADWLQPDKKRSADGLAELPIRNKRPRRQ
ncbi:zinc finger protein [Fusarium subglutinans]|uniref:Zinc finger protein n=1 Tax=Gibberella subglutinans TaxID=42677 RepID=A0A8H5QDN9_GIBSU|nr:zinc finger protein [Fusarium subglutinans]KAF5612577.1 zinc finger protein [Fusarium subglutinans]